MWSKNKKPMTDQEREHVAKVKAMACICCTLLGRPPGGPSEAHELVQGQWFTSIPLDYQCHRGPKGIHGDQTYLRMLKLGVLYLLNETLRRLLK